MRFAKSLDAWFCLIVLESKELVKIEKWSYAHYRDFETLLKQSEKNIIEAIEIPDFHRATSMI